MKNFTKLISALLIFSIFSCGGPIEPNTDWDFIALKNFQIKSSTSITSNSPQILTIPINGSVEENEIKILESLSKAGYTPATKVHELYEFTGDVTDYKLNTTVINGQGDPFEELEKKNNYIKEKEGIKWSVYNYFDEGTHLKLEKYIINNTIDLHNKAFELRKSMLIGKFILTERKYTNLNEFSGEDLEALKTFEPAFKLLNNTLKLSINEDGTYEESFPFMEGDVVTIKGKWELSNDFKDLDFYPADLSGNNLVDSYFLKNEIETELFTKTNLLKIKKDRVEFSALKYKGVKIQSSFTKIGW
jgi:hypothetical protein